MSARFLLVLSYFILLEKVDHGDRKLSADGQDGQLSIHTLWWATDMYIHAEYTLT